MSFTSQPQVPKPVSTCSRDTYVWLEIGVADLLSAAPRFKTNIQGKSSNLLWLGKELFRAAVLKSVQARLPF